MFSLGGSSSLEEAAATCPESRFFRFDDVDVVFAEADSGTSKSSPLTLADPFAKTVLLEEALVLLEAEVLAMIGTGRGERTEGERKTADSPRAAAMQSLCRRRRSRNKIADKSQDFGCRKKTC